MLKQKNSPSKPVVCKLTQLSIRFYFKRVNSIVLNMKVVKMVFQEVQSRKTEELYLSIQRAQEEACKDKHIQRIRDLAKKGHDVSKLLHSLEGDFVSQGMGENLLFHGI